MIDLVRLVRFKRFVDHTFDVSGQYVLLAGPNNSGKTTLLHALSAWYLALTRWLAERGRTGGKKRISIVLDEFTALPLREMNLLWLNRHTAIRTPSQKQPKPAPIYIQVVRKLGAKVSESLTMELMYANEKLLYVRPVKSPDDPTPIEVLPDSLLDLQVVLVPAFSGIGTQEPKHSSGMQSKLVGEGKPGEIVRNLLLEIWENSSKSKDNPPWKSLQADLSRLSQCDLIPPEFSATKPYIISEYRPKVQANDPRTKAPRLDVANAGSGFHQVLLLLAFFYAKTAAVLLLDEPDAHLHFLLQREIFDHLRSLAMSRGSQLIVGTHAEVLLDDAEPQRIISFVSNAPSRLATEGDRMRLQDAMQTLTALDFVTADQVRAVLYTEDESDYKILREWAERLDHPAKTFLDFPYRVPLRGRGNLNEARRHFSCLRMVHPQIRGLCILDRNDQPLVSDTEAASGLRLMQWKRYEIENYLLNPASLKRFVRGETSQSTVDEQIIDNEFKRNFPPTIDFLSDLPAIRDLKASDFLVDILSGTSRAIPKKDLFMIAKVMEPSEIHTDVRNVLDAIASIIPENPPALAANVVPEDPQGVDDVDAV